MCLLLCVFTNYNALPLSRDFLGFIHQLFFFQCLAKSDQPISVLNERMDDWMDELRVPGINME